MGHVGLLIEIFPVCCVEYNFTIAGAVFKLHVPVLAGVFEDLFGDFYVLLAILHDFFYLAFAPPADGLQAVR